MSKGASRFLLRLPEALHKTLALKAGSEGLSLNEFCVLRLGGPDLSISARRDVAGVIARAEAVAGRHLLGVIAHGSWVRGEARASSDVDVLVVVASSLPLSRGLYRTWDLAAPTWDGRPVDAHFVHLPSDTTEASSVWCETALEGLVIADGQGRVFETLVRVRRLIAEGRLVRKRAHGQPYWTVAA